MTKLYIATRIITFFGAWLRTFWEHLACRICKIPVEDIRPFRADELCGHIEHSLVEKRNHAFFVSWFPFTMNFVLACAFLLTGSYRIFYLGDYGTLSAYIFLWLGISCAANCAPAFEDVLSFKDFFYGKGKNVFLKIIVSPFYAVFCGSSVLEQYSLTFLMSIAFAVVFPKIFNLAFPLIVKAIQFFV